MATEIPGTVIASLAAKPDSLDLSEEEHAALAVVLAAGLESGQVPVGVEGFVPTAVELTSSAPFGSQLGGGEHPEIGLVYQTSTSRSTAGALPRPTTGSRVSERAGRRSRQLPDAAGEPGHAGYDGARSGGDA
jgi:hypothetical protein